MISAQNRIGRHLYNSVRGKQFKASDNSSKIKAKTKQMQVSMKEVLSNMKNPKTEAGGMLKHIAIGLGICCVGIAASLLGLR
jgi:hypothetical protein